MPVTLDSLRDEYAAAAEQMAGRALDVLAGGGGTVAFPDPLSRAELAAVRVLGPDLFAPALFAVPPLGDAALGPGPALAVAQSWQAFPPEGGGDVVAGWHDWATGQLAARAGIALTLPIPEGPPTLEAWKQWSPAMARLAPLALPSLDGSLHEMVRREPLSLARAAVRAMLRRDYRTAAKLARWLAWLHGAGVPVPVETGSLLVRLRQVGGPGARTTLDLTLAERLLARGER
ncbi:MULTISPECIES: hypothetical protein [unclassified Streptomyces]|uniref:hypothetical protein n=1 Tax=unclassified Streptomyces TaxID=2593676 RepID=UPI002E2FA496|nr:MULTISPECIES: hypothetical protein [unclassified Streptomyces]